MLLGESTIHEDQIRVPAKTTAPSGALVFDRDLVLLLFAHDERVAPEALEGNLGRELSWRSGPDYSAVRRDRHLAEHRVKGGRRCLVNHGVH